MISKPDPPAPERPDFARSGVPSSDFAEVATAAAAGLALAFTILFIFVTPFAGKQAAARDELRLLLGHRAEARLVHHANPYDRDAIYAIEHICLASAPVSTPAPSLIMRNRPRHCPSPTPSVFFPCALPASSGPCSFSPAFSSPSA